MQRLKRRRLPNVLGNEARRRSGAWTRWLYLVVVVGLVLWVANLFVGSFLYFQGQGMVISDPVAIATEFPVTVRALPIQQGDRVAKGQEIGRISSQMVSQSVARLTSDLAAHQTRFADLRIRSQVVEAMIGVAETRASAAAEARQDLERLHRRQLLSLDKRLTALDSEFRSLEDLETLRAERQAIASEMVELGRVVEQATQALEQLRKLYAEGTLRAPIDGIVGQLHVSLGSVVQPGQSLMEIYPDRRYILAYAPTGALYDLAVGDPVRVHFGIRTTDGTISSIEPLAAALPREFQRSFRPQERAQILRIALDRKVGAPPLFAKVELSSAGWPPPWLERLVLRLTASAEASGEDSPPVGQSADLD